MNIITDNGSRVRLEVMVKPPSARYLDQFLRARCAPDLLAAEMFPNAKEITESFAALTAVRRLLGPQCFSDQSIKLLDVGCGSTPRTAALFACMTRWETVAVDPVLRAKYIERAEPAGCRIHRISCHRNRIEDVKIDHDGVLVVVAVHAHVDLTSVLQSVTAPRVLLVAMPCCKPLDLPDIEPTADYEDFSCWSPKRRVRVWDLRDDSEGSS